MSGTIFPRPGQAGAVVTQEYASRSQKGRGGGGGSLTNGMRGGQQLADHQHQHHHPGNAVGSHPIAAGLGGVGTVFDGGRAEPMPELLARAFNEAVKPYTAKIDQLEGEVADLRAWIEQLEQQQQEFNAWIDKRGLRPGEPLPQYGNSPFQHTAH